MKKLLKTTVALAGIGITGIGISFALTSCGNNEHPTGLNGVNLTPSGNVVWKIITTNVEVNTPGHTFGAFEVATSGSIDNSLITTENVNISFVKDSITTNKLVATLDPIAGSTRKQITCKIGSAALVEGDIGVYTLVFSPKNPTVLPIASHSISFWVDTH